ncbi:MAG: class I SAM-dependent methyltransferase [Betaproteobacteria bacterium]|nr:class I SAM-dependent methyltransferase [Betaproteobacteria bacterium]
MLLQTKLERFIERLRKAQSIPLRLRLWNGREFELSPSPTVTLSVPSPSAIRYLLMPTLDRLGEGYVEGHLDLEGPIRDIIRAGEFLSRHGPEPRRTATFWRRLKGHSKALDADAIQYHYDVSNDFYSLWLDRNMVYSCGYFRTGAEDIHTAQEQKLDHICRKLMLRPGERFLDIGCGWGGLIRWAAKHYGVHATGITLSKNQHEYGKARIDAEGLGDRCELRLMDYRDVPGEGTFDKIASIGMFEHVGLTNLPTYFGAIFRLLKDGGLVMNHGITSVDVENRWVGLGAGEFIDRYVFPHGELPHLHLVVKEMASQNLEVTDVESLRPHYAQTLWHWATRLEQNRVQAQALAGRRRYRIWQLYLAGCAYGFEHGWMSIHQVLAAKTPRSGRSVMPWSREYLYSADKAFPGAAEVGSP